MTLQFASRPDPGDATTRGADVLVAAAGALDGALGPAPDGNGRLWLSGLINALRDAWSAVESHTAAVDAGSGPISDLSGDAEARLAHKLEAHRHEHEEMRTRVQQLLRDAMEAEWREPSQITALRMRGIHLREMIWSHHERTADMVFEAAYREIGGEG